VSRFTKGDPRAREAGRRGGEVTAAQRRQARGAYRGSVLDMMNIAGLTGPSWAPWRAFLKAVHGLPMSAAELALYQEHTRRQEPPAGPMSEAWQVVGRRGGKSQIAALVALHRGISFDASALARGELALIPCIAADRAQARVVTSYIRGLLELAEFAPYLERALRDRIELRTRVNVEIVAASFRTTRGYAMPAVICDEIGFWLSGEANPDSEILAALRPAMATVPGALLLALSSPYAQRGELYRAHERYYGEPDEHVLVWNASSRAMNPTLPEHVVERAFQEDATAAASEYGVGLHVVFRHDVEAFVDPLAVQAVTIQDRRELPPLKGVTYRGFVDPSGGSQDSFTLAVAHAEGDLGVLDAVREVRPPFSPDSVVAEFSDLLKTYGITTVVGDRYAGEWPRERFGVHGITYVPSERVKSDVYRETLAPINGGRVALLDVAILRAQLQGLERRVARGGRDSIDHAPGGHDDVANAALGALSLVVAARPRPQGHISPSIFSAPAALPRTAATRSSRVSPTTSSRHGHFWHAPGGVVRRMETPRTEPRDETPFRRGKRP